MADWSKPLRDDDSRRMQVEECWREAEQAFAEGRLKWIPSGTRAAENPYTDYYRNGKN